MFRLETERLMVRPWQLSDRTAFATLMSDPEVTRFIHGGVSYTEEEISAHFVRQTRTLEEQGICMGAAIEKSSGAIVGAAGAQRLGSTPDIEVGWIFAREVWGRGYATEVGAAAIRHVLDEMRRPRVVAIIPPEHQASKRVAIRLGMHYDRRYTGAELGHRLPEIEVDLFYRDASV